MGFGISNNESSEMKCRVCGGPLEQRVTDLPFKIGDSSIVILKALPVLQCRQCGETELEHATMVRVEQVLAGVDASSELEVIRFAA
jgi:YgiT-type zinc finger domain-containing protein